MPLPENFANFDIANAGVAIWIFKKSGGAKGAAPTYTGRWIGLTDELEQALKQSVSDARDQIEEVQEYGLLAQNNEGSVLAINIDETHAPLIVERTANALPRNKISTAAQLKNSAFYVVRFTNGDNVLYAVRKTDATWQSKRLKGVINVIFQEHALDLLEEPPFAISRHVDFFILDDRILIKNKSHFESVLNYKQAHADEFLALQEEEQFANLFTDLAPLIAFVGENKIQLRRICAIRQKRHYEDVQFMARLRAQHAEFNLIIAFDDNGLLIPTPETCGDIITALLDHRLTSAFSRNVYDVPDATQVN